MSRQGYIDKLVKLIDRRAGKLGACFDEL